MATFNNKATSRASPEFQMTKTGHVALRPNLAEAEGPGISGEVPALFGNQQKTARLCPGNELRTVLHVTWRTCRAETHGPELWKMTPLGTLAIWRRRD